MFNTINIDEIQINRETRQRRDLDDVSDLVESFTRVGQLNPVIIDGDNVLIAGERRITAAKQLGWTTILARYKNDLDELECMLIELDENIRRKDIPWLDLCRAVYNYHEICCGREADWTVMQTAEQLGMDRVSVTERLEIYTEIIAGNERVREAPQYSVARNIVSRLKERKRDSAFEVIDDLVGGTDDEHDPDEVPFTEGEDAVQLSGYTEDETPSPQPTRRRPPLKHVEFSSWIDSYTGNPFNFIHCDFPYGIGANKHAQGGAKSHGGYEDSLDAYEHCIKQLARACKTGIVAESAHLMFWFSHKHHAYTLDQLEKMGWKVIETPLIWFKSDNTGILPDAARRPRYVYESAFMASRGDRKIVQAVGNCVAAPSPSDKIHMSQKSEIMLAHFFRMFVDEYSRVLDPTCGSGVALKVAKRAGASHVLGLEQDREFYELARDNWFGEEL